MFKGYYIIENIGNGWLSPQGLFFPCSYSEHSKCLNSMKEQGLLDVQTTVVKFNAIAGFNWCDLEHLILTDNQKEWIINNLKHIHPDYLKELQKYIDLPISFEKKLLEIL